MSTILKIFAFPAAIFIMCLGILTVLGGHITPGGGFQGGAMVAAGFIFCAVVYGIEKSPFQFSHEFMSAMESIGALGYVAMGLCGLLFSGFFLYNLGVDLYGISQSVSGFFNYPDPTHAGIIPYLNIVVGLKVLVGLSAIVITFMEFRGEEVTE
ncbi:MnhB domain-containing protein [Methanothermobacter sp.]|uniref:MnhB domain-containing protein n=1 Tax=Methanothermobacter sp. TaxID=1884223 RepID=UPI003C73A943